MSIVDAADRERDRLKTADDAFSQLRVTALRVKRERDMFLTALLRIAMLGEKSAISDAVSIASSAVAIVNDQ